MTIILTIDLSPWSAYSGGAQRSTHNLATALARRGHEVAVVFTKPPWEHVEVPDGLAYDLHWATFFGVKSRRKAPLRPLNAFSVARVVKSLLDEDQLTVVHSNGEEGGLIHRLRPQHRFGFVATPRHPRYPDMLLNNEHLSPLQKLWLAATEGKYLMQGYAVRHADLCVPPSHFAASLVQQAYGIPDDRLRVIPNGVPEEFLPYAHDEDAAQAGPLVFFGRFEPTKGGDTLVEALGLLGTEAPRTLLIGRGAEEKALLRQVERLGLGGRVEVLPWMTHEALAEVLTSARMAVLPSRLENFSLAVLSAMAVGTPVISTYVGGSPEIIEDGATGLLVEPDAPEALAEAIGRLLRDRSLAGRLGRAGRLHVRRHFTWDIVAEAFEQIYTSLPVWKDQAKTSLAAI
ncbi:MAG TPA: glycosyltransferase family 4 protein [Rhodothermales bacterium]|nr:glycosyltransferase family 4 protein [Rhodothermales bacterium]